MKKRIFTILLSICIGSTGFGLNMAYAVPPLFSTTDLLEQNSSGSLDYNITAISSSGVSDSITAEIVIQKDDTVISIEKTTVITEDSADKKDSSAPPAKPVVAQVAVKTEESAVKADDSTNWVDKETLARTEQNVSRFDVAGTVDIESLGAGNYRMEIRMSDVVNGITTKYEPIYSNTVYVSDSGSKTVTSALTVSPGYIKPPSSGGVYTISVNAIGSWNVSSAADWVKVNTADGKGNGSFTITVDANKSPLTRNGTVIVTKDGVGSTTISIKQTAAISPALALLLRLLQHK